MSQSKPKLEIPVPEGEPDCSDCVNPACVGVSECCVVDTSVLISPTHRDRRRGDRNRNTSSRDKGEAETTPPLDIGGGTETTDPVETGGEEEDGGGEQSNS